MHKQSQSRPEPAPRYRRSGRVTLGVLLGAALAAGTAHAGPAKPPAGGPGNAEVQLSPSRPEGGMKIEGGMGELDAAQVEALLRKSQPEVRKCYDDVAQRLWYVGGHLELKVRVAPSGQARSVAVVDSTLGNYEVEKCIVQLVRKLAFPAPKGGEGELSYPVDFAPRNRVAEWTAAKVEDAFKKAQAQLKGCDSKQKPKAGEKQAPLAAVRATLYVGPGGKITSVGMSAADPIADAMGACLVKKISALQLDDPLGQMTRVSYELGGAQP